MILRDVMVKGKELKCDVCGWPWVTVASKLPECCPNRDCRSREWNGKKKRIRTPKIALPKPNRIRGGEDIEF